MKLGTLVDWIDSALNVSGISDVSNNGIQIAREGDEITRVAFGVDASVRFLEEAAEAGAQLAVVHHGISWGGGIARVVDNEYRVIKTAIANNIALYGVHLPLDASHEYGNNYEMARTFGLKRLSPAFSYHGETIGVVGSYAKAIPVADFLEKVRKNVNPGCALYNLPEDGKIRKVGICSGGAGEYATEAKALGCDVFLSGEGSWADVIAAENASAPLVLAGHYETEVFGVRALAKAMKKKFGIETVRCP